MKFKYIFAQQIKEIAKIYFNTLKIIVENKIWRNMVPLAKYSSLL